MADDILCCKKGRIWVPDKFLTTIHDNCSKGQFVITRSFTFPCSLLANGNIYIEEQEGMQLPICEIEGDGVQVSEMRCGTCGGEVEIRKADIKAILHQLRQSEITMKERSRELKKAEDPDEKED